MSKITAIVNGHTEGLLLGITLRSVAEAAAYAEQNGLSVEFVVALDRPDRLTLSVAETFREFPIRLVMCDHGELSASRNQAAMDAAGEFVGFMDGDDLCSFNWLAEAVKLCTSEPRTIAHPEFNMLFQDRRGGHIGENRMFEHVDSTSPGFDPDYLKVANCWSALSFARREVYLRNPYEPNRHDQGYGLEDWHWNCITLSGRYAHKPVPGTVHFIRRRNHSLSRQSVHHDVVVKPTALSRFDGAPQAL